MKKKVLNRERLKNLPALPGVYLLKNSKGKIIYIGKAKSLKNRIGSYFSAGSYGQESAELDQRKESMIRDVADFEYLVTGTELDALILEANLIKKERPRFNVILRDDKNYPSLRIDMNEAWPRLHVIRRMKRDGASYFGPFVPAGAMWETLSFIRKTFPLATCKRDLSKPSRPCLLFEMGRCLAPCAGFVIKEEYYDIVNQVRLFLQGKNRSLIECLEKKMEKESEDMAYEEAAKLRDRIRAIERVMQKQKIISPALPDMDIIGIAREGGTVNIEILFIRNGMVLGKKDFLFKNIKAGDSELIYTFLEQFYAKEILPPSEIIVPVEIPSKDILETWLAEKKGKAVNILVPKKGKRSELLRMAAENSLISLKEYKLSSKGKEEILRDIKDRFSLTKLPGRIEAFDISNIHGKEAVGSMVVFEENMPKKADYRHFRIRTVNGIDDFAMMSEIIGRRYKRLLEENTEMPDLIIVDGGKGQLNAARNALRDLSKTQPIGKIEDINIIGIAKEKEGVPDRVYISGKADPVNLPSDSASTHLLQRIRDESHRFAITYHRKLRGKRTFVSLLDEVPRIGQEKKKALLRHFGSYKRIKEATIEELKAAPGISGKVAENIFKTIGGRR
ncbi:MAG: excinuclease ABC subunit UvrC [Nitrospirota bacterium]